jgi:hypothetical protein
VLRACEVCGRQVDVVGVNENGPAMSDFHAWSAQPEQAEWERSGGSPPPEAYRELWLEENWP